MLDWLRHRETAGVADLDDPATTALHGRIIRNKVFLANIYRSFYHVFRAAVEPDVSSKTLVELGSGGGFIKEVIGNTITSDIMEVAGIDKVFCATEMPFADESVDAFFMIDVLHHINDTRSFFREALRCLKPGGKVVMIEPANTL